MESLYSLCTPKESVFDERLRDTVLDLTDFAEGSVDPDAFFDETHITGGMTQLFETAFRRFSGKGSTGIVKLTQSMGGGKTHNMIALGLLAQNPELRPSVLETKSLYSKLNGVKVIAFSGRETDYHLGIWGALATQLGKKELFKDHYQPLSAPGQTAWMRLLEDEQPLLILLDELPAYLESAKATAVADSNLARVTQTALANLFTAINKDALSRVCLVISDLRASYEEGSELIEKTFKDLEQELDRSCIAIEPVGMEGKEVYSILRKRIFKQLPDDEQITEIAKEHRTLLKEAKQMGLTNQSPDDFFTSIRESYPFHPGLRDLYARFKENQGFQQTRGLIRLMRIIVSRLYDGKDPLAKNNYLIAPYYLDFSDNETFAMVKEINPSLVNAIQHDISGGHSVAEQLDGDRGDGLARDICKLLLVSSLANVTNPIVGLSQSDIVGYLISPDQKTEDITPRLEELKMQAWYLHLDREGHWYFKNTQNMNAVINSLVDNYDYDIAKKELRTYLEGIFTPALKDCYQKVQVFPALDEIDLTPDVVTLVIFEPNESGGLQPELQELYNNAKYKNRILFLSGQNHSMTSLIQTAKERKAINSYIGQLDSEKTPENSPDYEQAVSKRDVIAQRVLSAARETFQTLYYPHKNGLHSKDFLMVFAKNDYNGEEQIRTTLKEPMKFVDEYDYSDMLLKCEGRLFTKKEIPWKDIKENAAINPIWQWHLRGMLDDLKVEALEKGVWKESGGWLEKGPFPAEKTSLEAMETFRDEKTGEVTLKLIPRYGDKLYWEVGSAATTASKEVKTPDEFKTKALKLSFLCEDSAGEHETGEAIWWTNTIDIKYRVSTDKKGGQKVELETVPEDPAIVVKYTTDGSNPKEHGGVYDDAFTVPAGTKFVLAVAEAEAVSIVSEELTIEPATDKKNGKVDPKKHLTLRKVIKADDTSNTYEVISYLQAHAEGIKGAIVQFFREADRTEWIELGFDPKTIVTANQLENYIKAVRDIFGADGETVITLQYSVTEFETGQRFLDWADENNLNVNKMKKEYKQ